MMAMGKYTFLLKSIKRPTFEVKFDTLKGSYKLDEEVKVKGFAKAYSGANIDQAKVSYRVVRNASFPSLVVLLATLLPYVSSYGNRKWRG